MKPIELLEVHKAFGGATVLQGVSLAVAPGEIVGFVGRNGAGKTTCLRILLGLVRADRGKARVLGMDPRSQGLQVRQNCCYLPGETSVYEGMRGFEFLEFACSFYPEAEAALRDDLLAAFALPLRDRVRTYSAGMKQKLALLATLLPDVEVYVLDEPDRALDATARFFLRDVLRRLAARGRSILLSSHHLREVEAMADRLVFLMDGRVVPDERVREARALLRERVLVKLRDGVPLPPGATLVAREQDGTLQLQPDGDAFAWLARIPRAQILAADVGVVRLEDLYRALHREGGA